MDVWPPPPTNDRTEPSTRPLVSQKMLLLGRTALAFSTAAVLLRVAVWLILHNPLLGWSGLLLMSVGLVLGLISRSTLAGRLALLGPLFHLGLFLYYLSKWYGG